jgi:Ca2+-transporting ATPase
VIGVDKTGTLTQNKMQIDYVYDAVTSTSLKTDGAEKLPDELIEYAMWASETTPFDPMEKAIHDLYGKHTLADLRPQYKQEYEYPIGGKPPIMTHIFKNEKGHVIISSKGAPEGILKQCKLSNEELKKIETQTLEYAKLGYRILGVGKGSWQGNTWPLTQQEFKFEFLGLIAFQDPPKENSTQTIKTFEAAGINVKMITGDYVETAVAIADQIQLQHNQKVLSGSEVLQLDMQELKKQVKAINIYARMFPEAKLKVIEALKDNGEVVAMTGDGVNDGPALKAAHIGIAMGLRGSGVAKSAASLIITDDDLGHMTDAIALGRKIYGNLEKAIQYIVSIHIPIILIVTVPLILAWNFTHIFTPVHVIFLELLMGPTCSIIYENEPMEPGIMNRPPVKRGKAFLTLSHLSISILQGLGITIGCLGMGYYFMQGGENDTTVRTVIFITLLFSNIFLTLVNRSFEYSVFKTITYKNNLVPLIIGITLVIIVAMLYLPFMQNLFRLDKLALNTIAACIGVAFVSTFWIEIWKLLKKKVSH